MKVTAEKNEKIGNMIFGDIYPLYLNKLEKKVGQKLSLMKSSNGSQTTMKRSCKI